MASEFKNDDCKRTAHEAALEAEVARLREVLGFYADSDNYSERHREGRPILYDGGQQARQALPQQEQDD